MGERLQSTIGRGSKATKVDRQSIVARPTDFMFFCELEFIIGAVTKQEGLVAFCL